MKVKIDKRCYFECDNIPRNLVNIKTNKKNKKINICYYCYYRYIKQEITKDGMLTTVLVRDNNHNPCNYKVATIYDVSKRCYNTLS